ncbi:MAG: dihydrolipoyl dehydrogenase [Ornithinimicrobium sp.]
MQSAAESAPTYDIVIVGGGSGGYACALRAAQLGLRVALVEQAELGGTCLHRGCIPTKALLHAAEVADSARAAGRFGVQATFESIDMPAVNKYKDGVVKRLYRGLQGLVSAATIDYVQGTGKMVSRDTVAVGDTSLTGRAIVLATGSAARQLPQAPVGGRIVTSESALALDTVPKRVIILGGGVIGVEFASIYRSFGAEVTVVEALDRLVAAEDEAISGALHRAFRKRGIMIRTGTAVTSAEDLGETVQIVLADGDTLEADLLLVAIGRGPVSDDLGLDEIGVVTDRGFVTTDDQLRTTVPGIYAVGDLVPGLQLAHRGFAQGIFVAEQLAGLEPTPIVEHGIPRVTYSDPEIVSVGLTEHQVRESFGAATCQELSLAGNGKSQILGTTGFVKLVRSASDGPVLGVHMIGGRMSEQAGEAQLIVNWEAMPEEVASLIHAHPTQNEALGEAHLALAGKPLHSHT